MAILINKDHTRGVRIIMKEWEGGPLGNWGEEFSDDFFCTGGHPLEVDDLEYCTEFAEDWKNMTGDFRSINETLDDDERETIIDNSFLDYDDLTPEELADAIDELN